MRSLRDLLIFVLCGIGLIVWGIITALSPGASQITDAGSPYWTIPLGIAMLATGFALDAYSRRRRSPAQAADPAAGAPMPPASPAPSERPGEDGARGPEGTAPPGA